MDKLIRILFENPLLLFILGAWIFGAISNAAKAKNKQAEGGRRAARRAARSSRREAAREASVQKPLPQSPAQTVSSRPAKLAGGAKAGGGAAAGRGGRLSGSAAQTPEEIAREMRRMLGLEPEPASPPPPPPRTEPPPLERPPEPVEIRTTSRDVGTRVDPHVGERIRDRHMAESKVGKPRGGRGAIGNLGGRVTANQRRASHSSRYSLDDLRKAIVINEILSPPVSARSHEDRRPG